jgi:predicted metal-binding membrane protein
MVKHHNKKMSQKIVAREDQDRKPGSNCNIMSHQLQNNHPGRRDIGRLSPEFIVLCVVVFAASISVTIYFGSSMAYEMGMTGGWKMSMMWMRMPRQTWFLSALNFLIMWLAMMIAMMMPSALLTFLKTCRHWRSLCSMAFGYFAIWFIAGLGIYLLGAGFNNATMRSHFLSRAVPLVSGALLIAAGIIQFTRWKMTHLLRCRSPFGCVTSCPQDETSFGLGCKQGLACCACCSGLMTTQLIVGIMNPFVMITLAIVITAEKLFPRPKVTGRLFGIGAIVARIVLAIRWATLNYA